MSFSIQTLSENGFELIRLADDHSGVSADILPELGACLHAFRLPLKNESFNIIDNYSSKAVANEQLVLSFKSSKLSPFVCRIPDGIYRWDGTDYEFTTRFMDGSAIHGLLFNKVFKLVDRYTNEEQASVRLRYQYKKDDAGYPFQYMCEVVYKLLPHGVLQLNTTITNLSETPIPLADGWHPYFRLGSPVNECDMQFASDSMLEFDSKLIPTGKLLYEPAFKGGRQIAERFFDNCFLLQPEDGAPVCVVHNPSNGITLSIFASSNYPYLQIYTPDHRQSIAIENLSGAPDCFNNGMGLIILDPRRSETFNAWYKVSVS